MVKKRRGLGAQGISAIHHKPVPAQQPAAQPKSRARKTGDDDLVYIEIARITPNRYQPRTNFDRETLAALAESIRNDGMLQPIVVRPADDDGKHELIAGERRWRAAQQCGLKKIPALVRAINEQQAAVLALVENLQREDLSPLEEAAAIEQLIVKFEFSHAQAGEAIGRSRTTVTNLLRLLKLGPEARELLRAHHIEMGHARALLNLPSQEQADVARLIIEQQLSVRATEQLVAKRQRDTKVVRIPPTRDADTEALERELSELWGVQVTIRHGGKRGGGTLTVRYPDLDTLDPVVERLRKR